MDELLRFERLLSDLSASFINIPYDKVDQEIKRALQQLVEFFGFDRGSVFQMQEKGYRLTHAWAVAGFEPIQEYIPEKEIPFVVKILSNLNIFRFSKIDDLPPEAAREKEFFRKYGPSSLVAVPLNTSGSLIGAVALGSIEKERDIPEALVQRVRLVGAIFANALIRKRTEESLIQAYSDIKELKEQLQIECGYLRQEVDLNFQHGEIIGQSGAIKNVLAQVERVATTNSRVLLLGETGSGKELVARAIHSLSPRKNRAMVKVNCAALPSTLVESELFGREKGAYTGALDKQIGRFEIANGSTIFLDEIGELSLDLQSKLLRVTQEGQFERLGSSKTITVDVRIIAATNLDLAKAVKEGRFREDLYYRLNVFPILVPPLRERKEDIPLLIQAFFKEFERIMGKTFERIPRRNIQAMQSYSWPGNIRELRNVVERSMILSQGPLLEFDLPTQREVPFKPITLRDIEKSHILQVLKTCEWRVRGKHGAADILGLKPTTLESKIKKLGIPRRPYSSEI